MFFDPRTGERRVERALWHAIENEELHVAYQLEITETVFACDQTAIREAFLAVKDRGVTCALDDFGTGFSSLSYLATLPLDKVKLDRTFVRDIETDPSCQAIVKSVQALAGEFGMALLCEGIETAEQGEILRALGCREAQGFYYGRPQPVGDLVKTLHGRGAMVSAA